MKKNITKSLSFVFALVLTLSVFSMTATAAGHVHNYAVTTKLEHVWINNNEHSVTEVHTHLCSCGDTFLEYYNKPNGAHSAIPGSKVYEGSYAGAEGTYSTYRYTCKFCGGTYRSTELSRPASAEQTE